MSTWRTVRLGDVATIERNVIDASAISDGTQYVGLENVRSGGDLVGVRTVSAGDLASSKFVFSSRHVLFGKLRPYLAKIARPSFAGVCSTDIVPIAPGPQLDRGYLTYFLRTPRMVEFANARASGANLPRVSPSVIAGFPIPLPSIPEQRRIAEILDKADALRAKRRATLAQLDTLTTAIFLDMFGGPGTNPRRWPVKALGELISIGPQNGLYKPASDYGTGTPILRIDGFYDGVVTSLSSLKRVRISVQELAVYGLIEGQIVVNRVNSREYLGKSAVIPTLGEPTVFESNMMRFDVCRDTVTPTFLIQYLQTGFVRRHILQAAKDAINQSSINQQDVKSIPVFVPPIATQAAFAQQVASAVLLNAAQQRSVDKLDALFASLQHRAFRGEL